MLLLQRNLLDCYFFDPCHWRRVFLQFGQKCVTSHRTPLNFDGNTHGCVKDKTVQQKRICDSVNKGAESYTLHNSLNLNKISYHTFDPLLNLSGQLSFPQDKK